MSGSVLIHQTHILDKLQEKWQTLETKQSVQLCTNISLLGSPCRNNKKLEDRRWLYSLSESFRCLCRTTEPGSNLHCRNVKQGIKKEHPDQINSQSKDLGERKNRPLLWYIALHYLSIFWAFSTSLIPWWMQLWKHQMKVISLTETACI